MSESWSCIDNSVGEMDEGCGFRYRRSSGDGRPSRCLGRISLVNLGASSDRVRKSSGGTLGAVKLENDLAAVLSAWSDAVRFDLKDLKRAVVAGKASTMSVTSAVRISSLSSGPKWSSGWSNTQSSFGGEETSLSLRSGSDLRLMESGVLMLSQCDENDGSSKSNEGGIVASDSLDIDLDVANISFSCSILCKLPYSSSDSSTRPSSKSRGEPTTDDGVSESSCFHSWISSSIDIRLSTGAGLRRRAGILGIAVTASKAATAGGIESALCVEEARAGLPPF